MRRSKPQKTIYFLIGLSLFLFNPVLWSQHAVQEHGNGEQQEATAQSHSDQIDASTISTEENHNTVSEGEDLKHGAVVSHSVAPEEADPSDYILDHVLDSHEWHLWTNKKGEHTSIYLPVILYSKNSGLHMFMSGKIAHGHNYQGFEMGHGVITTADGKEVLLENKIVEVAADGDLVAAGLPLDLSITKNVFMMILSVIILLFVFLSLAKSYKRVGISEPKGMQGFLEPIIVMIEEDVARPNIGEDKYTRYMPYLLTIFFFILLNNLMGIIPFFPFGANVTGNIAVTMVLAVFTFLITTFSGNREYWKHIFNTPGVPIWLAPIMIPVEIIGMFTKPFALMIRLFANITAGHIIVLSLISMIFIFKSIGMAVPSLVMVIFMDMIELLVAFLQAYIFTLLSALFIGMAMPVHHHD